MIKITTSKGRFKKTTSYLQKLNPHYIYNRLDKYGQIGVERLREATPKDTGLTSESWSYKVRVFEDGAELSFINSNTKNGIPIAVLIQYGHGMPNGGYVQGIDYINPALKPVFEAIKDHIWQEVTSK